MQDNRFPQSRAANAHPDQLGSVMNSQQALVGEAASSVLRNTYMLLGLTVAFSALVAYLSMGLPHPGLIVSLVGFYGLLFLTYKTSRSAMGLISIFAFTGFIGYTLGPVIGMFAGAGAMPIVVNALGLTAFVFFGLSAYALVTRKDFSFLAGFIVAGVFTILGAFLLSLFVEIPGLHLAMASGFVLIGSAIILLQTGQIIHGGQDNYILATIDLYLGLYYIFSGLLQLLMAFGGDD